MFVDSSDGGQWWTYDEIAKARGTEKIGAIRWVQRHKWRRQPGNDGLVRVLVPHEALVRTALRGQQSRTVTSPKDNTVAAFEAALAALREAHAGELAAVRNAHDSDLAALREQLGTAEARHTEDLAALREQLHTTETRRVGEITALQGQLRTTKTHHAEELRALQEQLHIAAARADGLATDLTSLGEQLRTAESRTRTAQEATAALGTTVDELRAGQGLMAETHATELAAAQDAARKAEEQAEALRQVEEARKGRGRWARLRAAWRGE